MPNKTIYVKNEELWNKAKAIAGKEGEGLSGVIADALARFVQEREAAAEGQVVHRFTIERSDPEGERELERVGFAGREIDSRSFSVPGSPATIVATVYATKGGKFVLTLGEEGEGTLFHYAPYSHLHEIAQDETLVEFGDEGDIQEWAASVHRRHFEETATETWIE